MINKIKLRYWIVLGYFIFGVGWYALIMYYVSILIDKSSALTLFGEIMNAMGYSIYGIYFFILSMTVISALAYLISKFRLKNNELTIGFKITSIISFGFILLLVLNLILEGL